MLIIPAIDIYKNKVARLHKGKFEDATFYNSSPLEYAIQYSQYSFEWLHVVDLEASAKGLITTKEIINQIKRNTNLKIQFGGGIKSFKTAIELLELGVDRIIIGSISISNKKEFEKIVSKIDNEKIIVAIDSKDQKILIKGWLEQSETLLQDHINYCATLGLKYFLCTDVSRDGTLTGPNFELYIELQKKFPNLKFIASGGISKLDDLMKLKKLNIYATVVGKALYENKIKLTELKKIDS